MFRNNITIARMGRTLLYMERFGKKYNHGVRSISFCQKDVLFQRFLTTISAKYAEIDVVVDKKYSQQSHKHKMDVPASSITSEGLLEKLIHGLSSDIHQKNRVYKNDLLRVVARVKEMNFSTKKQGLLLIRCCTELLPEETTKTRIEILEQIWDTLKSHTTFEVEHYNELLRAYIANHRSVNVQNFIQQMAPVIPNMTTYELFLQVLGEVGDINQASEVLSNMKSQNLPATEKIFNSLIICQGKVGNLRAIQEILSMMTSLKLDKTIDTYVTVARALAFNKKYDLVIEEMKKAQSSGFQFDEFHVMEIVKAMAVMELYTKIPEVLKFLPVETLKTPSISPYMQSVATLLLFQNHPLAALHIYKCLPLPSFGPKDDQGLHGRSLMRDCVKASVPTGVITLIADELMSSGRNAVALQNATEAALQLGKVALAQELILRMKHLEMPVRPHYFWPILIHSSRSYGEKGVINTLSSMVSMDLKPDYETMMDYVLPYVSFTSPQNLMKKFREAGLTVSTVLTPMMETLLNTGQVRAASEICELFKGKVEADKLLKPLLKGYLTSLDIKSTIHILEDITVKAADKNKDWVGRFLCTFMQHKTTKFDLTDLLNIVKAINESSLKISSGMVDYCISCIPSDKRTDKNSEALKQLLIDIGDDKLTDDGEFSFHQIPHPKQMNEESLRAHLVELEAKNMNTRGVLRKLLQEYCREGNLNAAKKILEKCKNEGIILSAGMKASIFDMHVKAGELDLAELVLVDLNKTSPNFTLDEFKIIDYATLMVYKNKTDRAFDLINEQSKKKQVMGGRSISMNCWRLLDAMAMQGSPADVRRMLETLVSHKYCRPTNQLLGPLIRVYLNKNQIQEAVSEFVRIGNKYNKTPLKHELLCHIVSTMGDGKSETNFLANEKSHERLTKFVQTVLTVDKKIHGGASVQLTLVGVLAEVGYKKTLRKLLLDPTVKFHSDALLRRCERFAQEKNVDALAIIAECAKDLRHLDVADIYDMMLDVYHIDNNSQDALSLWSTMQEKDVMPSRKFVHKLCSLLNANKQPIPPEVMILLDQQFKR